MIRLIFLFTILFSYTFTASSQNYEYGLEIAERYFEEGNYKKAHEKIQKITTQLKRQRKGLAIVKAQMQSLKYLIALAEYSEFEALLVTVLKKKAYKGENTLLYAKAVLDASLLYIHYSDIVTAANYLELAKDLIEDIEADKDGNNRIQDTYFASSLLEAEIQIHYKQGLYDDANKLLPALKAAKLKRIVSKELYFNEASLKIEERKLDAFQLKRRKREYAEVLILEGNLQRKIGNYEVADRLLNDAAGWIKAQLNTKDPVYIQKQYAGALLMIDREESPREIRKKLEKILFLAERRLSLVHSLYLNIQETLIDHYIATFHGKSKLEQWEIRTNTSKYFGKENTKHVVSTRLDAKKAYYDKNLMSAQNLLDGLYEDKQAVPENHSERVKILQQLYEIALAKEAYPDALKYLNELRKTQEKIYGGNALAVYYTDMALAGYYLNFTNQFETTDSLLKASFYNVISKRIVPTHTDYTRFLYQFANYHELKGDYNRAKDLCQQIVDIKKEKFGDEHINYAAALDRLINIELSMGEFKQADKNIEQTLEIFELNFDKKIDAFEFSQALETAARYYALMGLFDQAESLLSRSRRFYERTINAGVNSSAVDELAYLYLKTERFKQAESMLQEAVDIREERYGSTSRFLIKPYNQLARLAKIYGDYVQAEDFVNRAQEITESIFGDSSYQVIESLIIHAEIDNAIGDYDGAEALIKKAISIEEQVLGPAHIQLADTYAQLALNKFYSGENLETVEVLMERSLSIIAQNLGEENPIYAEALKNTALIYTQNNKLDEASSQLEAANRIWITRLATEINTNSAEIELLLGDVALKKGEYDNALSFYKKSKKIYNKIFNKNHPEYVEATARVGRGFHMLDKFNKAKKYTVEVLDNYTNYINEFFPALSDREKARFWNKIRNDFEFFNNLSIARAAKNKNKKLLAAVYNNTMSTKSLLLSSSIKVRNQILNSNDSSLISSYKEWTVKKETLTKVLAMGNEQLKEANIDPKKLEKEIEEVEKELSNRSKIFDQTAHHQQNNWKEVKKSLQKDEVAIELIRYRHFNQSFTDSIVYAALIVKPDKRKPELVLLPKGNLLESNYLRYYRYCIIYNIEDENSYHYYWKPIHDRLPESTRIYLSAEGVYNQVNLEAMRHPDGNFVLDHNNLILISSTSDLVKKEVESDKKVPDNIALFGNPVFYKDLLASEFNNYNDRQISQLPGTQVEVNRLDSLLNNEVSAVTDIFINKNATEDKVKSIKSPKIFHIATHGFFMPDEENLTDEKIGDKAVNNPLLRSGLLLSNAGDLMASGNVFAFNKAPGVLTAYEAMNLSLDETELVVLSACETGRGENKVGEGVYGLQRAFLVAGAKSIIMSLFKVSDEATQELMVNFYRNWLGVKMDKRTAFREAKRELREKFNDPLFWGAFVMIGNI
ncbi:MAG: CHAT domain-containing tetratricopeptide repeat protein [Bacteroidota bacterium]